MTINVTKYRLNPDRVFAGTSGSFGMEKLSFNFDDSWDFDTISVTFHPQRGKPIRVPILSESAEIDIPAEVMAHSGESRFVVSGVILGDGGEVERKAITLEGYVDVAYTADDKGGNTRKMTADVYDQLIDQATEIFNAAREDVERSAAEAAESASDAEESADTATQQRRLAEAAVRTANIYKNEAKESAESAAEASSAAKKAAEEAQASERAAKTSEENAAGSAAVAGGFADATSAAVTEAVTAKNDAVAAKVAAETAKEETRNLAETAEQTVKDTLEDAKKSGEFDGPPGDSPYIGENGNWWVGETDTGIPARGKDGQSGQDGEPGANGTSVTVTDVQESTEDGGSNVVTFSDGKTLTVKNGNKGETGEKGDPGSDYVLSDADKQEIAGMIPGGGSGESDIFNVTLTINEDGTITASHTSQEIYEAAQAGKTITSLSIGGDGIVQNIVPVLLNPDYAWFYTAVGGLDSEHDVTFTFVVIAGSNVSTQTVTINQMTGASANSDGTAGLVPQPLTGQQDYILHGDGVWRKPAETISDTSANTEIPTAKAVYDAIQEHGGESGFFAAHYGQTSYEDIIAACTAGKLCYVDTGGGCAWLSSVGKVSEDGGATYTGFAKFTITSENPFSISAYEVTESGDWSYSTFTGLTTSSRVTTVDEKSTDYTVPSAKAVYDAVQAAIPDSGDNSGGSAGMVVYTATYIDGQVVLMDDPVVFPDGANPLDLLMAGQARMVVITPPSGEDESAEKFGVLEFFHVDISSLVVQFVGTITGINGNEAVMLELSLETNETTIMPLVQNSAGSGGGGGIVTITSNEDGTYSSSHTPAEIATMAETGAVVAVVNDFMYCNLFVSDEVNTIFAGSMTIEEEAGISILTFALTVTDEGVTLAQAATPIGKMHGADTDNDGTGGTVPAPAAGEQNMVLHGDGTWRAALSEDDKTDLVHRVLEKLPTWEGGTY